MILLTVTFVVVVLLDLGTKYLVQDAMPLYTSIPIVGEYVKLTHIRNPGAAFGISVGSPALFLVLSMLACGVVAYYFKTLPVSERWGRFSLTLVLGGAVGNLIDRIRFGEVTDFIEVGIDAYRWPVFNVADMAVTIGVVLLFIRLYHARPSASLEQNTGTSHGTVHREDRPA